MFYLRSITYFNARAEFYAIITYLDNIFYWWDNKFMASKSKSNFLLLLSAVTLIIIIGGLFFGKYLSGSKTSGTVQPVISSIPTLTPSQTANWKTYKSKDFKFSFEYPSNWEIRERGYDDNGSMMIFIDPNKIVFSTANYHGRYGLINVQIHRHPKSNTYMEDHGYNRGLEEVIGTDSIPAILAEEVTLPSDTRTGMQNVHYQGYTFDRQEEWLYTLSVQSNNSSYQTNKTIFDQILSTFKFLD